MTTTTETKTTNSGDDFTICAAIAREALGDEADETVTEVGWVDRIDEHGCEVLAYWSEHDADLEPTPAWEALAWDIEAAGLGYAETRRRLRWASASDGELLYRIDDICGACGVLRPPGEEECTSCHDNDEM